MRSLVIPLMQNENACSRGEFLMRLGLGLGGSAALAEARPTAAQPAAAAASEPSGADMGSLYPDILRLAESHGYEYSFLTDRFKTLEQFQSAAREKVFDLLLYLSLIHI